MGGHTLNNDEQWVVLFRRSGDKVFLVRRNVRFQAKRDVPVGRAKSPCHHATCHCA